MSRKPKPVLHIIRNNHFDPIWRRCWDRRFSSAGQEFASYADLEDWYITDNLALARREKDYKFEVESAVVLRQYLKRHPGRLAALRRLAGQGRFAVTGAGDNIIDVNMVLGESIVRNWLLGLLWVEDTLGQRTRLAVRNDGFGNCAQLPQILRGCELAWVRGLSYTAPQRGKLYWRGLDGSTVCFAGVPTAGSACAYDKYPPCPRCAGHGCRRCGGRGIDPARALPLPPVTPGPLDGGVASYLITPEEYLPDDAIFAWVRRHRRHFDVRYALSEDAWPYVSDAVGRVDDPPADLLDTRVELNPNNSGVWVTRIKLKQATRRQEYELLSAEMLNAAAWRRGAAYPRQELDEAWQTLLFTMFHDAITATHVDAAYEELRDMQDELDGRLAGLHARAVGALASEKRNELAVINPQGQAASGVVSAIVSSGSASLGLVDERGRAARVLASSACGRGRTEVRFIARDVPAMSAAHYRIVPAKPVKVRAGRRPVIENDRFRIEADDQGLTRIVDKRLGRPIARSGDYRPGELILERDIGSPWATLHPDRRRLRLAEKTVRLGTEIGPGQQRLSFRFNWDSRVLGSLDPLRGQMQVTLYEGLDRVEFRTCVEWDCYAERVRVAMPLPLSGQAVYGVPYGMLPRAAYTPRLGEDHWASANGDWPAIDWAGVEAAEASVALLSRGLPSYAVEPGGAGGGSIVLLSLLRSPTLPTYLHEPRTAYSMTAFDGMRDAGRHEFRYALCAYDVPFADSSIVADAESYNAPLVAVAGRVELPDLPRIESDNVRISAIKRSEKGDDLVVRLAEFRGRAGAGSISVPADMADVTRVNLLERQPQPLPIQSGRVRISLRPWEIATLRMAPRPAAASARRP